MASRERSGTRKLAIIVASHVLSRISTYDFPHIGHDILFRHYVAGGCIERYAGYLLV